MPWSSERISSWKCSERYYWALINLTVLRKILWSVCSQSVSKRKRAAWMYMWGIIRATFTSAQPSLYDEQPALEGWIILFEHRQIWTVPFMSASVLSYNIDKSVPMWSQFERIMCVVFKMMIFDLHRLVFIKNSLLVWVSSSRNLSKYSFQETKGKSVSIEELGLLHCSVFSFYQNLCANGYYMILVILLMLHLHTYIVSCSNSEIWNSSEDTESIL